MRRRGDLAAAVARINLMALGYVLVWALFSVGATALQRVFSTTSLLTMMMEPASPRVAAVLLLIAAVYQWTPLKTACLHQCRSPLSLFTTGWREGSTGAFRMGVEQGAYCLGCCWALMLLLFAGGVMNLAVILALTAWVAIEKIAPFGQQSARAGGVLLVVMAMWLLAR
jgi:predicted metal-binding membrane protein